MTTTLFIKLAWLKITIIIENVKNSKTRENQSMLYTATVVLGLTKVPYLTRVFLTRKREQLIYVDHKFLLEVKKDHSKM